MAQDQPGFEADIKPLFRARDRQSMSFAFDLFSFPEVSAHADRILERLRAGEMPCDREWPASQVQLFERWVQTGKSP